MSQNDTAAFTLNDVTNYFILFLIQPAAHGKQKTTTTFCQPFFEILRPKKITFVNSYPTDSKKSLSLLTLTSYKIAYKTILQKNSCAGKWEKTHSFTQLLYGKPKKEN